MKTYFLHFQKIAGIVLASLFVIFPFVTFATSTLIPCGFDRNEDHIIKDTPGNHEECDFKDLVTLAQNVINYLIIDIAAPLAAIMFAYAGFLYVTNRGNEGQVTQAHDIFLYVFWGLVVALAAWLVVNFILEFALGSGSSFNLLKQ